MLQTTVRAALAVALALGTLAACTPTPNSAPIASQSPAAVGPSPPTYAQPGTQAVPPPPEPSTAPKPY
jgi:hypothetical protein